MLRCSAILSLLVVVLGTGGGCSRTRVVTISTVPPDATIRVDQRERGRGPLTETFNFSGGIDAHRVQAEREGYRSHSVAITPDFSREFLIIELKPATRRVVFSISPMPAMVKLDGRLLSPVPVTEVPADVEFRLEPTGKWSTHTVTAEREGFEPTKQTLRYEDRELLYSLNLEPMRKTLQIATTPPQADVFINEKHVGKSTLTLNEFEVPVDIETGEYAPQKITIKKEGYQDKDAEISWDGGKTNYEYKLEPQAKVVRVFTEPKDATVMLGGVELQRDPVTGAATTSRAIPFGPRKDKGELTAYSGLVRRKKTKDSDSEWEEGNFTVEWEGGKTDYTVKLKEILVRGVPLLRVRPLRGENGWLFTGERASTVAMKDVTEGSEGNKPVQITKLEGAMIDTVNVSPDGSQVVFTTLSDESGELRSQIFTQSTQGPADPKPLNDGRSLEITPAFTPDGLQIVFASNRVGKKLNIWSMSATQTPVPEQLTNQDSNDLWPSVDSNPKPRLYYQSCIDRLPEPRLFSTTLGTLTRKDLTPSGGMQPRVAPTADAVVFAATSEKNPKRDLYRMSDLGGDVVNLTNTPEIDEFDAAWSSDGQRLAYVSDRGHSEDAPDNYDIWVIDAAGGSEPIRITGNASWDDSPAWDVRGRAIYFRSNRGGEWNIWRIELK